MLASEPTFHELLAETWQALRTFDTQDLSVVSKMEELVRRAPAELTPPSVKDGFEERDLVWLSLPLEGGRAVATLLRATEAMEGGPRPDRTTALSEAGIRLQIAASAIAAMTASRIGGAS